MANCGGCSGLQCFCPLVAGNCITISGMGTIVSPYTINSEIDPAADNLITCQPAGLLANLFTSNTSTVTLAGDGTSASPLSATGLVAEDRLRVRRAAVQSIPDSVTTVISWDIEDVDTDGFISVPSSTITIPVGLGGIYSVSAFGLFASADADSYFMSLIIAGRSWLYKGAFGVVSACVTVTISAGDTIITNVFQDTAGAKDVTARLEMYRLSPTP